MIKDHEKFKNLLSEIGLSYKQLAEILGMTHDSVKSMLAPAKNLPKWAVSMIIVSERLKKGD